MPELIGTTCISCKGSGLTGFFGVATVPCWRCGGSGRDPHPGEPYPKPTTYSYPQPHLEREGDDG